MTGWSSFTNAVLLRADVEELEHEALGVGELVIECLDELAGAKQAVAAQGLEEGEDLVGGRGLALPAFGVERDRAELALFHGGADLALDERVEEDRDEVEEEKGLDALDGLEVDRNDLGRGLELLVALFDEGLELVGLQQLELKAAWGWWGLFRPAPYR